MSETEVARDLGAAKIGDGPTTDSKEDQQEDVVDPWNVHSSSDTGIDYDKLIGECIPSIQNVGRYLESSCFSISFLTHVICLKFQFCSKLLISMS